MKIHAGIAVYRETASKGERMTGTRLRRATALVALVALMALGGLVQPAAANDVVCTTSGDCTVWEPPDCSAITPDDEAQWWAYLYEGGPYPSRDLDYGNCLGF